MSIADDKKRVASLIEAANHADEQGDTELADRLTRMAAKAVEKAEDDQDLADSESDVDSGDPLAKGFGRSLVVLYKKVCNVEGANNLKKKLEDLKKAKGCEGLDTRKLRNALEDLCEALHPLCK